ncbi:hypothetical protein [Aristaeella lactis]|uniref:Uncharacterized protein n=1 Tax=Aristaeella lactis TaxID=3046383 RepID=A0AC61PLQ8_9FIRM|nr:hypothetical protein [Aristaeella lactis]QUA52906.1 hypothetical protein JYE50_14635 [Aristaeella lactis]SMC64581.1 hypothetical protein SAMN06297397_1737 [Aristaeella lactis]
MKTDVITVSSRGKQMEKALEQADKVAAYKGLSAKDALHLRLLTEEMMGLMRSITGEKEGTFWIEDQDGEYQLHLKVRAMLTSEEREQLLAVSSSGKNESAKGLMGRLRDFFDWGSDADLSAYSSPLLLPDAFEQSSSPMLDWEWSMSRYERVLSSQMEQGDQAVKEAWDELEKSVVSHVADDVKVAIRSGTVEMIIIKKLA